MPALTTFAPRYENEWLDAVQGGPACQLHYAAPLTEYVLPGIARSAATAPAAEIINHQAADNAIRRQYARLDAMNGKCSTGPEKLFLTRRGITDKLDCADQKFKNDCKVTQWSQET